MTKLSFKQLIKGKKVLFITTKNMQYIRNSQEVRILESEAEKVEKISSLRRSYFLRILEIWWKLLWVDMSEYDVAFVGFAPQLVFPFYYKLSRNVLIIDFFISVYDTLVNDRKKLKPNSFGGVMTHRLDEYVIKKADIIITDTKADASYFINEFEGNEQKFETLYLEADNSIFYARAQNKRSDLKNKYVVLYFGSILPLQGIEIVLKMVELLKEQSNIYMQIIGPISKKYCRPMQSNVEYIDWLPQEQLAEYIANCDLCLAGHFHGEIDKAKRTIPGKSYIYQNMQKPMILGDGDANREIFQESSQVYFVKMGDAELLKNAVLTMYGRYLLTQ